MNEHVTVAMATFPPRREGLIRVVEDLLPQCDRLCVYLNGYTEADVPPQLRGRPKLEYICAGPGCKHPDIGSHGKLHWAGQDEGYYLTVDDDILYPPDYVAKIVEGVDRYGGTAIVSLHGVSYKVSASGAFDPNARVVQVRTIYPYDKRFPKDVPVHGVGMGCMGCKAKALGVTSAIRTGHVHSGDDEDMAVFAQKHRIPMIKLAAPANWTKPNAAVWIKEALHRRTSYLVAAEAKLKAWTAWRVNRPAQPLGGDIGPDVTEPTMPTDAQLQQALIMRHRKLHIPLSQAQQRPRPQFPAPIQAKLKPLLQPQSLKPSGPCFDDISLDDESTRFCHKILSSDALAALIVDRIKKRVPTSVIRMSNGERGFIDLAAGKGKAWFMNDANWLKRYGLEGADLAQVGRDLVWAGGHADFLACTILGLFWECFRVHDKFEDRAQFIDQFYPQLWQATDRVGAVLRAGPVLVLHRQHADIVPVLRHKYGCEATGLMLNSWRDQAALLERVKTEAAATVLVSGGASGKPFCVRLAQATGKVVLDVGEALTSTWVTAAPSAMATHAANRGK